MNFEFVKNLQGLNKAFDSFANAEDLAMSKPDLSMVASRKSAEALAKYIYFFAYSKEAEKLTFSDILSDPVVKRYLNNVAIMDAFHFVRKKGNVAVHTLNAESSDTAILVLRKLHFVVGEAAKRMGLISKYPEFNANIRFDDSVQLKEFDTDALAKEMYDAYIIAEHKVDKLMGEFTDMFSPFETIPGNVELGETIEFKSKPILQSTTAQIQEHFGFVIMQALKKMYGDLEVPELSCSATLTIYGENGYTTSDLFEVARGLFYDLPEAEGFKISNMYYGPSIAPWFNSEVREEFYKVVDKFDSRENFTYTIREFLYNHGSCYCGKFENGNWVDLEKHYSSEILDKDYDYGWWSWNVDLYADFDFESYPEILEVLHKTVRKYIPKDQLKQCEEEWENGEPGYLVSSIGWYPQKLRMVQDFLDEINTILEPIKSECDCGCEGSWYIIDAPFAVATWFWTDEGFKIMGTSY